MPGQVRIISGPRNTSFDHYLQDIVDSNAYGVEHEYFGIGDLDRAVYVRNKLHTARTHLDPPVSVKAFRKECGGCKNGGPECKFHVSYTVYQSDVARAYKDAQDEATGRVWRTKTRSSAS
jgi:hypothetical protein